MRSAGRVTKPLSADQRRYRRQTITCQTCGASHVVERPNARFCSDACKKRHARAAGRSRGELVQCRICAVDRPPTDFYALRGGLDRRCKACVKALARLRRARNRFRLMK